MKYLTAILFVLFIGCVAQRKAANTVILDGTASRIINGDGTGYFKTWQWRQIQGNTYPIDNPSSVTTQTQITKSGNYAWELVGKDNLNNVGKDTFNIKIK